jgi:hypothetical protein
VYVDETMISEVNSSCVKIGKSSTNFFYDKRHASTAESSCVEEYGGARARATVDSSQQTRFKKIMNVGQVQELRWLACPSQSQVRGELSESLDDTSPAASY